ncbi:MAG: histidine kinase [Oscillospiraceae bacterium]
MKAVKKIKLVNVKRGKLNQIGFAIAVTVAIIVSVYSSMISQKDAISADKASIEFSDGWSFEDSTRTIQSTSLLRHDIRTDKTYNLSKKLPDKLPQDAVLFFQIDHNSVKAYIEDAEIRVLGVYTNGAYGIQYSELYAAIALNQAYAGRTISLTVTNKASANGIDIGKMKIMNQNEFTLEIIKEKSVQCMLFVAMLVIALMLFAVGIKFRGQFTGVKNELFMFLKWFILIAAIWILLDSKILSVIFGYNDCQYFISFYSFMIMPIPFALFVNGMFDNKNKIFDILAGLLTANFLLNVLLLLCGVIHSHAQTLFVVHILVVILACATFYVSIYNYLKYKSPGTHEMIVGMLLFVLISIIALFMFYFGKSNLYSIAFAVGQIVLIIFLSLGAIRKAFSVATSARLSEENETKSLKAQNSLLVSQISSHFFYHVLSAVRTLIKIDPNSAYKMMGDLSKYLRYKTDSGSRMNDLVKFSDELKAIEAYVALKKVLLGDRLKVIYEIENSDFYIPVLSVQPIVENAIKHGIEKKEIGGTVRITAREDEKHYNVIVEDDGMGFDENSVNAGDKISVSRRNIEERLSYYGDNKIEIENSLSKGTKVTIRFIKEMKLDCDDGTPQN